MNILEQMFAEQEPRQDLSEEQQAARLLEIFAKRQTVHRFEPGDILRHKYASASGLRTGARVNLFIRYLPEELNATHYITQPSDIGASMTTQVADCEIAIIDEDGEYIAFFTDSATLEPHPNAEKLKGLMQ